MHPTAHLQMGASTYHGILARHRMLARLFIFDLGSLYTNTIGTSGPAPLRLAVTARGAR